MELETALAAFVLYRAYSNALVAQHIRGKDWDVASSAHLRMFMAVVPDLIRAGLQIAIYYNGLASSLGLPGEGFLFGPPNLARNFLQISRGICFRFSAGERASERASEEGRKGGREEGRKGGREGGRKEGRKEGRKAYAHLGWFKSRCKNKRGIQRQSRIVCVCVCVRQVLLASLAEVKFVPGF